MDFLTGKQLPRRTFLRGVGVTLALPMLDAMIPAGRLAGAAMRRNDPTRLICMEMVHGAAGATEYGRAKGYWSPLQAGRDFDLSTGALAPLEPFRDHLTIISDTDVAVAEARIPKEIGGDHFRSSATFLTQSHPRQTEGSDILAGTSLDQIYAQRFGQDTPLPSMQLCIENVDQSGGCAYGYACVYTDTISWKSPTEPLPMIRDPRIVFDRLFGAGGSPEARAARRQANRSVLDFISGRISELRRDLGQADRRRVDRYLESVREIERRISRVEALNSSGEERDLPEAPAGVPDSFVEHVQLMFDLQVLAFQTDVTRVFSFKLGRDSSARVFPESGVDKPFHPASHHGGDEDNIDDFAQINRFHVSMVPYLLERLQQTMDGEADLLEKTMIVYGSPMGDPNVHNHKRCPLFVVGGANGRLDGGVHVRAQPGTPMANALLSLGHCLGLEDMDHFGDSTGMMALDAASISDINL